MINRNTPSYRHLIFNTHFNILIHRSFKYSNVIYKFEILIKINNASFTKYNLLIYGNNNETVRLMLSLCLLICIVSTYPFLPQL